MDGFIRFSAATQSFYPYDIEYVSVPVDVVDVPVSEFNRCMDRSGGVLSWDGEQLILTQLAPTSEELLAAANTAKERALANLTVTVDGMTLKADSEARQNMTDAISAAETLRALPVEQAAAALGLTVEQVAQYGGVETLTAAKPWKLADKTVAIVTLEQLKLASALAIVAVGQLVIP